MNTKYNSRDPNVIEVRSLKSEYIVYYDQNSGGGQLSRWNFERVSDMAIVASGSLEAMLSLLNLYPNSRRATWAEDMLRYKPIFYQELDYPNL